MKIISPSEISGKIMTLIQEARKDIIIVSPYYKLTEWRKLINRIDAAKRSGVNIKFYVRSGESKSIQEVRDIGYEPTKIDWLHAKLYFNEKTAIVSSMNLNESSDANALDIGMITETQEEYNQVKEFYQKFIEPKNLASNHHKNETYEYDWPHILENSLLQTNVEVRSIVLEGETLVFYGRNKYLASIDSGRKKNLRVKGIISGYEFEYFEKNIHRLRHQEVSFGLEKGGEGLYDQVYAFLPNVMSSYIDQIIPSERKKIADIISSFIFLVEKLKDECYNSRIKSKGKT